MNDPYKLTIIHIERLPPFQGELPTRYPITANVRGLVLRVGKDEFSGLDLTEAVLRKAVEEHLPSVLAKTSFGTANLVLHEEPPLDLNETIRLADVSHQVTEMRYDEELQGIVATIRTLQTPPGHLLATLFDQPPGTRPSLRLSARGAVECGPEGVTRVALRHVQVVWNTVTGTSPRTEALRLLHGPEAPPENVQFHVQPAPTPTGYEELQAIAREARYALCVVSSLLPPEQWDTSVPHWARVRDAVLAYHRKLNPEVSAEKLIFPRRGLTVRADPDLGAREPPAEVLPTSPQNLMEWQLYALSTPPVPLTRAFIGFSAYWLAGGRTFPPNTTVTDAPACPICTVGNCPGCGHSVREANDPEKCFVCGHTEMPPEAQEQSLADRMAREDEVVQAAVQAARVSPVGMDGLPRLDPKMASLEARVKELESEVGALREEVEHRRVQLGACSLAAMGHTGPKQRVTGGQYGWSAAYQDVLELRERYDLLVTAHKNALKNFSAPSLTDPVGEVEKLARDLVGALNYLDALNSGECEGHGGDPREGAEETLCRTQRLLTGLFARMDSARSAKPAETMDAPPTAPKEEVPLAPTPPKRGTWGQFPGGREQLTMDWWVCGCGAYLSTPVSSCTQCHFVRPEPLQEPSAPKEGTWGLTDGALVWLCYCDGRPRHSRERRNCHGCGAVRPKEEPQEPPSVPVATPPLDPSVVPAEVHEKGWQWRPTSKDGAFAPPFGTIRACLDCGCLTVGGPTRCGRCARDLKPDEAPISERGGEARVPRWICSCGTARPLTTRVCNTCFAVAGEAQDDAKAPTKRQGAFHLWRKADPTGTSGTGAVAQGFVFSDGTVALHWLTAIGSTAIYDSLEHVVTIHGHNGNTEVLWDEDTTAAKLAEAKAELREWRRSAMRHPT